jgi:dolichol-phosphate mannosyltransferase
LNERDNVALLVERLDTALTGVRWEAIFVDDDSQDGTAELVRALAQRRGNIRCVQRLRRRGLASACIEGILSSAAPYIAVMDGDLQHDEALLPRMLATIKEKAVDVVIASRYAEGGSTVGWHQHRAALSDLAGRLGRLVIKAKLSDPMSGFFLIERNAFAGAMRHLSGQGFKILLDIFASSPRPLNFAELPLCFRARQHGESKLDAHVALEYLMLLADKSVGYIVPVRFLLFATVGGLGVFTHLISLWVATYLFGVVFPIAQMIATVAAMTGNFVLNNIFTYRDRRLRGRRFATGLLSFYAVCALGAAVNVSIASHLFGQGDSWWMAGLAGAVVGAVWNYAMSSLLTWRDPR